MRKKRFLLSVSILALAMTGCDAGNTQKTTETTTEASVETEASDSTAESEQNESEAVEDDNSQSDDAQADENLKGYDSWLDLYISDRKDIGIVNIAAGEKEKSVKFYKEDGDFSAAITLYFANYTDSDLPLSECTLKGVEVTDAVDLVFDDTIHMGSSIDDMVSLYGTAYNAGGLAMSYKWANDECEYEIDAYVDNDNKITKFEWHR